jgi:hypothetical protein
MMDFITRASVAIKENNDFSAGALAILYRKRISTPTNLEAILRMMDADVRTGLVRCRASTLITFLSTMGSIYGLKMNDGSYFASCLVSCSSKSLKDDAKQDRQTPHDPGCHCGDAGRMLLSSLRMVKEDHAKVLDRVIPFDWKEILETHVLRPENGISSYELFYLLWHVAMSVLVLDRSNSKAKSFLRKLGSCHELFRGSLRRLVALIRSLPSAPTNMSTTLKDLNSLGRFCEIFHHCLVPPPSDPEIEVLVSLANHSLKEVRPTIVAAMQFNNDSELCITTDHYDRMITYTQADWWTRVKHRSDDDRWRSLERAVLSHQEAGDLKKNRKTQRQSAKKDMKSKVDAQHGNDEMCTNCFRLESGLLLEGKRLMKCACKQVNYCSPECQKEHWKKFHRKECVAAKGKSKKK